MRIIRQGVLIRTFSGMHNLQEFDPWKIYPVFQPTPFPEEGLDDDSFINAFNTMPITDYICLFTFL